MSCISGCSGENSKRQQFMGLQWLHRSRIWLLFDIRNSVLAPTEAALCTSIFIGDTGGDTSGDNVGTNVGMYLNCSNLRCHFLVYQPNDSQMLLMTHKMRWFICANNLKFFSQKITRKRF